MTREEQIKSAASNLVISASRADKGAFAKEAFELGAKWADANPRMPDMVVKIPERSREEIKELLANWKGTLLVGDDIYPSPWISVEEMLPETTDEFGRSEDVLILDENGWRTVAMYCIPENKWYLSVGAIQGDCEYPFEITHWMPIPQLPKGE